MKKVKALVRAVKSFHALLIDDRFGRYRSWEHCYRQFYGAITHKKKPTDRELDHLSLHLGMYLASWGMYRGSSFLLQQDYRVHLDIVKEILKPIYRPLLGIKCSNLRLKENKRLLKQLSKIMVDYYVEKCADANRHRQNALRRSNRKAKRSNRKAKEFKRPSETLITKILMGTLGCTPAYDTYFIKGLKNFRFRYIHFMLDKDSKDSEESMSLNELIEFYEKNEMAFKEISSLKLQEDNRIRYPEMKLIDMMFWREGWDHS